MHYISILNIFTNKGKQWLTDGEHSLRNLFYKCNPNHNVMLLGFSILDTFCGTIVENANMKVKW